MNIILDIIVILIVLIVTFINIKRGFVKSIMGLASLVATVLIISTCSMPISTFVYDTMIDKYVRNSVVEQLEKQEEKNEQAISTVWDSLPKIITNTAENSGVTATSISALVNKDKSSEEVAENFSKNIIRPTAISVLSFAINIILFIVLMLVFRILSKVICKLFKAPVLKQVNKVLGLVLGVFKGIIIASLVCVIVSYIVSFSTNEYMFINQSIIEKTFIFSKMSNLFGLI